MVTLLLLDPVILLPCLKYFGYPAFHQNLPYLCYLCYHDSSSITLLLPVAFIKPTFSPKTYGVTTPPPIPFFLPKFSNPPPASWGPAVPIRGQPAGLWVVVLFCLHFQLTIYYPSGIPPPTVTYYSIQSKVTLPLPPCLPNLYLTCYPVTLP